MSKSNRARLINWGAAIPSEAVKIGPSQDVFPPIVHSEFWTEPIPLPGPVYSAGAKDSPFITPDGSRLFFFFTPDVSLPVKQQLTDGVTGIYQAEFNEANFTQVSRMQLREPGKLALVDCPFFAGTSSGFVQPGRDTQVFIGFALISIRPVNGHVKRLTLTWPRRSVSSTSIGRSFIFIRIALMAMAAKTFGSASW